MGLFDGLMGNASSKDIEAVQTDLEKIILSNEKVEKAYAIIRDMIVFTNKRVILIDKQGLTGKKTEYYSIPYKSITHFVIETAGTFDLESELQIFISGGQVYSKPFKRDNSIHEVQKTLATYVL